MEPPPVPPAIAPPPDPQRVPGPVSHKPEPASSPGGRSKTPIFAAAIVATLSVIAAVVLLAGGGGGGGDEDQQLVTGQNVTTIVATPATTPAVVNTTAPPTTQPVRNSVQIDGIQVVGGAYSVTYRTNFEASIAQADKWHIHFYFNTVAEQDAGVPGVGPWIIYDTPSPFTQYKVSDKPSGATRMCASVATHDHRIVTGTQSCWTLPS